MKRSVATIRLTFFVMIMGALIYAALWSQVIYRVATICDRNPAIFADCEGR